MTLRIEQLENAAQYGGHKTKPLKMRMGEKI